MTLKDALNESEIEVAEIFTDGKMVVVGWEENPDDSSKDGWLVSFKIGDMPPYAQIPANDPEHAEHIVARNVPYEIGSEDWEARESE